MDNDIPFADKAMFSTIVEHLHQLIASQPENVHMGISHTKIRPNHVAFPNQTENMYIIHVSRIYSALFILDMNAFIVMFAAYVSNIRFNLAANPDNPEEHFLMLDVSRQPPRRLNLNIRAKEKVKVPLSALNDMYGKGQMMLERVDVPTNSNALMIKRMHQVNQRADQLKSLFVAYRHAPVLATPGPTPSYASTSMMGPLPLPPLPSPSYASSSSMSMPMSDSPLPKSTWTELFRSVKDVFVEETKKTTMERSLSMTQGPVNLHAFDSSPYNPFVWFDKKFGSVEADIYDAMRMPGSVIPTYRYASTHAPPLERANMGDTSMMEAHREGTTRLVPVTLQLPMDTQKYMDDLHLIALKLQGNLTPTNLEHRLLHVPGRPHEYMMQYFNFRIVAIEQLFTFLELGHIANSLNQIWLDPIDHSINFHIVDKGYPNPFRWLSADYLFIDPAELSFPALQGEPDTSSIVPFSRQTLAANTQIHKRRREMGETPPPEEKQRETPVVRKPVFRPATLQAPPPQPPQPPPPRVEEEETPRPLPEPEPEPEPDPKKGRFVQTASTSTSTREEEQNKYLKVAQLKWQIDEEMKKLERMHQEPRGFHVQPDPHPELYNNDHLEDVDEAQTEEEEEQAYVDPEGEEEVDQTDGDEEVEGQGMESHLSSFSNSSFPDLNASTSPPPPPPPPSSPIADESPEKGQKEKEAPSPPPSRMKIYRGSHRP